MENKYILLFLAFIICLIMVSVPYLNNDLKASSNYEAEIHSVDSDGDYLPDVREVEFGTDPYNPDTDGDLLLDMAEIYLGTDPVVWDTDSDGMMDGLEIGSSRGSTSPFLVDTDSDGLPDPWEDNDGDDLLNREEQLPMHDGIMWNTDPYHDPPEERPSTDPNNADTDGDGWNDGFELQVNSTYTSNQGNAEAVNPPPVVDRKNSETNIGNSNSYAYWYFHNVQLWDDATFADWRNGLKAAGNYNIIPRQCTNIAWYHFSPYYIYEQAFRTAPSPPSFDYWRNEFFHNSSVNPNFGVSNETLRGDWDRGAPYDWNRYDCDPTLNDTDGDAMDDNWDTYPLRYNVRNSTFAAINAVRRVGEPWVVGIPPYETNIDQWDRFGTNITTLEIEKGDWIDINVSVGFQHCDPDNGSHANFINNFWNPMQVRIQFRRVDLGIDNMPHTPDDSDVLEEENVAFRTVDFTNVLKSNVVSDMREQPFINHLNQITTITFYYQIFRIRVPSRVPAGQIALVVETIADNNFHYFPSDEFYAY